MCHEKHSLRAEIMHLSTKNFTILGTLGNRLILLLDYIQLISPILIIGLYFQNDQEFYVPQIVQYFIRVINPASWLFFEEIGTLEITILCLIGISAILKYLLFGYIALVSAGKVTALPPLIYTWKLIFHVQGRFLYFITSSFWISAMILVKALREFTSNSKYYGVMFSGGIMVAMEFIFSLYLSIYYVNVLPSKKFLAAKDNTVEIITLIQKLVIQILILTLDFTLLSTVFIFASFNCFIDLVRNCYFFGTLPFYSFKALSFQAVLQMTVTALNISYFTESVVKSVDGASNHILRLVLIWIVISLLLVKVALGYIDKKFWDLVANPGINSPVLLIHRICAIEQIRNMTVPLNEYHEKNSWTLLVNNTLSVKIKDILKIDRGQDSSMLNINDRDLYNQMIQNYLAKLIKLFPKNKFIQLCTAQFYLKQLKLTQYPTSIVYKLKNSSDRSISLGAELLLMKAQDLLKNKYKNDNAALDLRNFLHEKSIYVQLKQKVIEQANLQIKICDEIKKESPNLAQIFTDSQKLAIHRERITKALKEMLNVISDYHIDPILFCARYHLILNHSLQENLQYTKQYSQKLLKYQKFFDHDTLVEENIFGNSVGLTIISEIEPTVGKVVYVSPSFSKKLGQDSESMLSMNILKNSPPCLQEAFLMTHKMIAETGEKLLSNQVGRAFVCHKEGYLIEIDYYMNLHPFITSEFYLSILQRPVISNREFMYVLENGDIDCITRGIGQKLNIKPSRAGFSPGTEYNLRDISSEIALINEASNMVFYTENPDFKRINKNSDFTIKEAKEIYSVFSTTGKDLTLKAIQGDDEFMQFSYHCKIVNIFLGKTFVKLITLEENSKKTKEMREGELETPEYILEQLNKDESEESHGCEAVGDEFSPQKRVSDHEDQMKPRTSLADYIKVKRDSGVETTRCKDTQRDLLGSYREEDFTRISEKFQAKTIQKRVSESTGGKIVVKAKKESEGTIEQINAKAMSVATSKWSKFSQQKRIFYLYKKSLMTKHYPKIYQIMLVIFFLAFIVLLLGQVLLKITLDDNVEDLSVKKDILRCAQSRTYQLIGVQSVIRILWDLRVGALTPAAFGSMISMMFIYPFLVGFYASQLSVINNELLLNTTSLDPDIREIFFAKDVRIYDNYFGVTPETYTTLDNFQATNRIVDSALEIANQGGVYGPDAGQLVPFVLRNTLNGLLIKNEEISNVLVSSLKTQRDKIDQSILAFFIGLILLFVVFLIVFTVYLWKQYFKQVTRLSAVCRVNPAKLNEVYRTFVSFKIATETEDNKVGNSKNNNSTTGIISPKNHKLKRSFSGGQQPDSATKREYKSPNHLGLRKDCLISMGKFSIMTGLVIVLITITSITSQKHIEATQDMQSQIFFLDHSKSRVSIAAGIFLEVTSTNNTAKVEDVLVLEKLEELADELEVMTRDLYATFIETENNIKDSEIIQTVLIGDSCKTMLELFRPNCEILQDRGYKPGLIYLLTSFSTLLKAQTQKYRASTKTEAALNALKNEGFETTALMYVVSSSLFDTLSAIIDANFEEEIEETREQRIYILVVYFIAAIFISVVMWRCIMVKLRAGVNKFKNVLAVLPADLVLASFILRSFLMKTSNGVLNAVKNDLS